MATQGTPITWAELDALATLANTKLSPAIPYAFPPFAGSDAIAPPEDITAMANYGAGIFIPGRKVTFWLFSYKTISSLKTYSWTPVVKAFVGVTASGSFAMQWDWVSATGPTAPDGYLAVIPSAAGEYFWKDIGSVETLIEDGNFTGWINDGAGLNDDEPRNVPCGNGIWLKLLNRIHRALWTATTLFGGATPFTTDFILSGPWCVSVAPKLYLTLNDVDIYENILFYYNENDSLTGNEISSEADIVISAFAITDGANNFNFNVDGTLNGRIILMSNPNGQSPADWTLSSTPAAGVTITFEPNFNPLSGVFVTAFIFDFEEVPYTVGTPIVCNATPTAGGHVIGGSTGGRMDVVFTAEPVVNPTDDALAIHYAGVDCKTVALLNTLPDLVIQMPNASTIPFAAHWRVFCNGVFVANTIGTLGVMPYLDQDLPQYAPFQSFPASSRRVALTGSPYIPSVANRGALWPVYRDTQFTPALVAGMPLAGSYAWQKSIFSKFVNFNTFTDIVDPSGFGDTLLTENVFVDSGASDARFYTDNPLTTLYVKAGSAPTTTDFDAMAAGGAWISLAASVPGFATGTLWYYGMLNPTTSAITVASTTIVILTDVTPNGTFFPTHKDIDDNLIPNLEGFSYKFSDPDRVANYPIPMFGYCVYQLSVRRAPVDNGSGIAIAPTAGTSSLTVKIGVMAGFGFDTAGTFEELTTLTIPSGQSSGTTSVFFVVLGGAPLAYQCDEVVIVRAACNFQPQMHSQFSLETVPGTTEPLGFWNGPAWYDQSKALYFETNTKDVVLPISASVVNDLTATLNLFP